MLTLNQKISILPNDLSGLSQFSKEISGGILEDSISSLLFLNEKIYIHDLLISEPSGIELVGGGGIPSISYDALTQTTTFDGSFVVIPSDCSLDVSGDIICNGNFQLGSIVDVEQKIIDISNNSGSIQVNSIPINAFHNITIAHGAYFGGQGWGRGYHLNIRSTNLKESISHYAFFNHNGLDS